MKTLRVVAALVVLLCAWGVSGVFAQSGTGRPFITKWQGTKNKELKIPIVGTYKIVIKDESGNAKVNAKITVADAENPYIFTPTENGTYTVEVGPEGVKYMKTVTNSWESVGDPNSLREVVQFGTVAWESMEGMFARTKQMILATDIDTPDLSKVTNMSYMFSGCSSFNQPLEKWDVSNVTNMGYMFIGCSSFNQPLENWEVSNVTNMVGMFNGCLSFNQPLGKWKIKKTVGGLFTTAMSPLNYSKTLVGWALQPDITKNLYFGNDVKNLVYNDEGKAARDRLITEGWMFNGDKYQSSGVAITPCFLPLVRNKEFTLLLEKWGVEETEEVTLSTDMDGIISYKLTADKKGVHIKGLKEGKCQLTATIAAKPGVHEAYTTTCEVEVYIPIERITVTPASKTLKVGEGITLTAHIFPENATKKDVNWSTGDSHIATIDNDGKVTAKKKGKCTIYARISEYGREIYGMDQVIVGEEIAPVISILLPESQTLQVGTITQLVAVVLPDNAERGLVWSSSDPAIATVSEGIVWGKKKGTCTITVKSLDKTCTITKECKITVKESSNGGNNGGGNNNEDTSTTFTVTLTQPTNGKIAIEGHGTETSITVEQGTTLTVKVTPDKGYKLKELKAGEEDITNSKQFTVTAVTEVKAVFEKETFAVKTSVNNKAWGSIELTGATDLKAVEYGTELTVTVTKNEGYKLKSLKAGNEDITAPQKFIVKAATEVKALFEKETFAVTINVNDEKWGSIALAGASDLKAVAYGTELTVTVTENKGYELKELKAGDADITATKKFIVKAATEVKAVFESKQGGAVEDALLAGIVVAPNPFSAYLRILNPEGVAARYELVNASGIVVRSGALSGSEAIVDTETLPAGIYFVRLEAQNGAQKSVMVSK